MTTRIGIVFLACTVALTTGCLRKPSEPSAGPANRGPGVANQQPAGGGVNSDIGNMSRQDLENRRDGSIFAAGGGGGPPIPAGGGQTNFGGNAQQNANNNAAASGGMANGLFPQFPLASSGGGGTTFRPNPNSPNFGGGLFPQGRLGGPAINTPAGPTNNPLVAGGGGGAQPAGNNSGASSTQNTGQAIGSSGLSPSNDRDGEVSPQQLASGTFLARAEQAFRDGNEQLAANLLYAHFLSDEDSGEDFKLRWFDGLFGPRLFCRFGVGITYNAPRGFQDLPPAIGEPYDAPNTSRAGADDTVAAGGGTTPGGANGRDPARSPYVNVDTATPAGMLLYYTGDFGERFYKRLNDRRKHTSAYFGDILKNMPEPIPTRKTVATSTPQPAPQTGPGGRNNPLVAAGGGGGGAPATDSGGGTGTPTGTAATGTPAVRDLTTKWSLNAPTGAPSDETTGTLLPGVMVLGQANRDTLVRRARAAGLDLLLVFEITVQQSRNSVNSLISLRLLDISDPEKVEILETTSPLHTTTVGKTRSTQTNDRSDPVELALDEIFQRVVDEKYKAADLPEGLNSDNVSAQIERLVALGSAYGWRSAVEIMGYLRRGLVSESDAEDAIKKILGDEAQVLISGTPAERKQYLETKLIKPLGSQDSGEAESSDIR